MDHTEEQTWRGNKVDKYFRQVKPRPRISWPSVPEHSIVAPPTAISIEPYDPDVDHNNRADHVIPRGAIGNNPPSEGGVDESNSPHTSPAQDHSSNSMSEPHPPTSRDGRNGAPNHCTTAESRRLPHSNQRLMCGGRADTLHAYPSNGASPELNEGQVKVSPDQQVHHLYNRPGLLNSRTTVLVPRPRKRFRKKVSGLFGENTDLKKRMSKLIQDTDITKIKIGPDAADADLLMRQREPSAALMDTGSLLSSLPAQSSSDSFDFVELTEAATKALGSPEKLEKIRAAMGTLEPSDNQKFLDELNLGGQGEPREKELDSRKTHQALKPPTLPPIDDEASSNLGQVASSNGSFLQIGTAGRKLFLPAVPAVLRSKTRRAERGYRSKDVLEARLRAAKGLCLNRSVPGITRPLRKGNRASKLFPLSQDETQRLVDSRKRSADDSHHRQDYEGGLEGENDDDLSGNELKRRRRKEQVDEEDLEASPVTMATSDRENEPEDRRILHNPLSMLVEAATGHQNLQEEEVIAESRRQHHPRQQD